MVDYTDDCQRNLAKVKGIFKLYNAKRYNDLLQFVCDDIVSYCPTFVNGDRSIKSISGKSAYRKHLEEFREAFGQYEVISSFPTATSTSVLVVDERGNPGNFSFEVTGSERLMSRVFFLHQPDKQMQAA